MISDWTLWLEWFIKGLVVTLALLTGFAYLTWYERRALARIQVRIGPNRAGPFGLLQPIADAVKLIFKEELTPGKADRIVFFWAPIITLVPSIIIAAVIPWGDKFTAFGRTITLSVADINVGVLYLMSIASIAVYGIVLAGWSSNNKYAMLGGLRSSAQMISYELALGLSLIGPIMLAGSLDLGQIVEGQSRWHGTGWLILFAPLSFITYLIAAIAETNRVPFDLPEAETELVAGFHTEYSAMKFALFFLAEYINMFTVSMLATTLFLGGWNVPFADVVFGRGTFLFALVSVIGFLLKVIFFLFLYIWIRGTLPRFRFDQLMSFGWKFLLPLALVSIFVTATLIFLNVL